MMLNSDPYFGKPFQLENTSPEQWQHTLAIQRIGSDLLPKAKVLTLGGINTWIGNTKVNASNIN